MSKEEQVVGRPWKEMPVELLHSMSNLPLSDHLRFRLTCKSWKNAQLPPRSHPPPAEFTSKESTPQFITYHSSGIGKIRYFNLIYDTTYQVDPIPDFLVEAFVCHSKYGWLLLTRAKRSIFFFHPLKKQVVDLPKATFVLDNLGMSFSSPPTSSDCVVFAIDQKQSRPSHVKIHFCRHGSESWHTRVYEIGGPTFVPSLSNPVFYDGVFYCLSVDRRLGFFDPRTRTWEMVQRLVGPNIRVSTKNFLVECDGDVISVCFGRNGVGVWILKLDWREKKWVELDSLGDRMILVSDATSMLLPAILKGTENKIYLPRFGKEGNVFYSLYTRKYSSFFSELSREDWYKTREYVNGTWINFNNNDTTLLDDFKKVEDDLYTDEELNWLSNATEYDSADDSDRYSEIFIDDSDDYDISESDDSDDD